MKIEITPLEARVIGCLLEKEITTPEQYPLSLSALTNACNQKSSRDPVLQLDETEVQDLLDELKKKHLVSDRTGFGSRVAKYQHRFCNSGFGAIEFSPQALGILCLLLLRGPQTPGELRSRSHRLCTFSDVAEVESTLRELMQREDGPFVVRLAREPGRRESRYMHLFCGEIGNNSDIDTADNNEPHPAAEKPGKTERLESLLNEMAGEIAELKARVEALESRDD
ncbi:MAG: DUF480 domain-containing protein [Candidatus Thiodiazotropha sp.]